MINGFILINKEAGITSRKVCNRVSFLLGEKKVGHIGTLDPFAEGLLIACVNKATKAGAFIDETNKTYVATLKLGQTTDTLDCTGKVIENKPIPKLNEKQIVKALNSFVGEITQTIPITSAVHVNGKRLYEYAHSGQEVELPKRKQTIFTLNLISFTDDSITFEAVVNRGTYIRVLAAEIAKKLGTAGFLEKLVRTKIGSFAIEDSVKLDSLTKENVLPIYDVLSKCADVLIVNEKQAEEIKNGKIKNINHQSENKNLLIVNKDKEPIAMYIKEKENIFAFQRGLF
ncbi:MAG: tRNA pseudouridine(55) synthase TruB [Bacilli bacterium]|nr:tRNA pseudouridine(55) synthase TruB [Bacilli bacterium]